MKRILFYVTVALLSLAQLGCVQHYRASSVKSPDYSRRGWSPLSPQVLGVAPTTPYVVVGTIEIRASRSATAAELLNALGQEGVNLCADAVIPPSPDVPRTLKFESINPYRVYTLFGHSSQKGGGGKLWGII